MVLASGPCFPLVLWQTLVVSLADLKTLCRSFDPDLPPGIKEKTKTKRPLKDKTEAGRWLHSGDGTPAAAPGGS